MRPLIAYNFLILVLVASLAAFFAYGKSDTPQRTHYSEQELRGLHLERALELKVE